MQLTREETKFFKRAAKKQGLSKLATKQLLKDMEGWMALRKHIIIHGPVTEATAREYIGPQNYDRNPNYWRFLNGSGLLQHESPILQ